MTSNDHTIMPGFEEEVTTMLSAISSCFILLDDIGTIGVPGDYYSFISRDAVLEGSQPMRNLESVQRSRDGWKGIRRSHEYRRAKWGTDKRRGRR